MSSDVSVINTSTNTVVITVSGVALLPEGVAIKDMTVTPGGCAKRRWRSRALEGRLRQEVRTTGKIYTLENSTSLDGSVSTRVLYG
jgi:YVTN family beta-propeller protein